MGYALQWHAFRGKSPQAVCDELGLKRTGTSEEIPESRLVGAQLPDGWYVVLANNFAKFGRNVPIEQLSAQCDVVICSVEEHTGYSSAEQWHDGREVWSIVHDASAGGLEHLESKGNLPPAFAAVRDQRHAALQAAGGKKAQVDCYFDIPLEMAKAVTGFVHDEDWVGAGEAPFEVLEPIGRTAGSPLIRKLAPLGFLLLLVCGLPLAIGLVLTLFHFLALNVLKWL